MGWQEAPVVEDKKSWRDAPEVEEKRNEPDRSRSLTNIAGGAIEPLLSLITGGVATPIAGLAGIVGTLLPGKQGQGRDVSENVLNSMTYKPRTEGGKFANQVIGYPFQKLAEGADIAGAKVTDVTGLPELGTAVNVGINALPMLLAKKAPMAPASETAQGAAARWLMQKALKPDRRDLLTGKAQKAIGTMLDEGINPTEAGMNKASRIATDLNNQVETLIKNSTETVSVPQVATRLADVGRNARSQVNPQADLLAIQTVLQDYLNNPALAGRNRIPVQEAHSMKKGTYKSLGDKAYGEQKTSSVEAQKALARGLREEVANAVPEVSAPLKREADLMNVLSVAEKKALGQGNNNPLGLTPMASSGMGMLAFFADRSAAAKASLARLLYTTGNPDAARAVLASMAVNKGQVEE